MNTKACIVLIIALALLGGAALLAVTWAAPGDAPLAQGGAPTVVAYQGEVRVSGAPHNGDGYFKFAVVDAAGTTTYWSNDGTSTDGDAPTAAVQLAVSDGLFSVLLGDTALGGMTQALAASVFDQPDRYLRVWFSSDNITFDQLTPDTRVAAVPYALQAQEAADADTVDGEHASAFADATHTHAPGDIAPQGAGSGLDADTVDGLHASELGTHYQNVVVVAQSGGNYSSVQAAIDSIADAGADNPYLVWVAPGVYSETVTMKPFVHLQGAGQEVTIITSTVGGSTWPPDQTTLILASDTSLRDLTVGNSGAGDNNAALLATAGTTRTLVADVTARALGNGASNLAIFLSGSGAGATLQGVTTLAENGNSHNIGLVNHNLSSSVLHGGNYTARGGTNAWGIFNTLTVTMKADNVTALGENGSNLNSGMYNWNHATVVLYGGDFTGRGGNQTGGTGAANHSTLTACGVTALAENGSGDVGNFAMGAFDNSTVTLSSGVFTARGGVNNYALSNELTATMKANNVTALAENGSGNNYGFWNDNNAQATVRGGDFIGRGGTNAYGVYNAGSDTTLEAESVTALGEDGSSNNFGLENSGGARATLRGSSFTAREGTSTYGIFTHESGTTLEAESVAALGENSSGLNYGMENYDGGVATLRGGSFAGRGGNYASGIQNTISSTLTTEGITALGEDGSNANHGLVSSGSVTTTLHGGSFTGRGGAEAWGIHNEASGTTLEAESVTALGEDGSSNNYGLSNTDAATATLRGGAFTGRGGTNANGIRNIDSGTTLEAESVNVLAEHSSSANYGLENGSYAQARLHNGAFTGRGGTEGRGILNDYGGTLEAENITALGEEGSSYSVGLVNYSDAVLRGGAFTGQAGYHTRGIYNANSGVTLMADNVTAPGKDGGGTNYGLYNYGGATADLSQAVLEGANNGLYLDSGTVHLAVSELDGDATCAGIGATLTCFQVYDGNYVAYTCPTCP
jgi:hypothetical protein